MFPGSGNWLIVDIWQYGSKRLNTFTIFYAMIFIDQRWHILINNLYWSFSWTELMQGENSDRWLIFLRRIYVFMFLCFMFYWNSTCGTFSWSIYLNYINFLYTANAYTIVIWLLLLTTSVNDNSLLQEFLELFEE